MNGYDVSLKHSNSVWCVCSVIFNVIHSYLPNYRTANDEGSLRSVDTQHLLLHYYCVWRSNSKEMQQEAAGSSVCLTCRSLIAVLSSRATQVSCMLFVCAAGQTGE